MPMIGRFTSRARRINISAPKMAAIKRPTFAFMRGKFSRWIALGFGSGLAPLSPGTFGTLFAWLSFLWIQAGLSWMLSSAGVFSSSGRFGALLSVWFWPVTLLSGLLLGVWACERCGRDLGVSDHGAMVWDEVIAFWLVLWVVNAPAQAGGTTQFSLFLLFRFFDIFKPPPIGFYDASLKGGWGVMADDLIAAFYTLLVFALWRAL
jgi:phosphatidylglycerophosphatase A